MRRHVALLANVILAVAMVVPGMAVAAIPTDWQDYWDEGNPIFETDTRAYYPDVLFSTTGFDGHGPDSHYKMYYDDGSHTWLAYSNDGETWERFGSTPIISGLRHPQVLYDAAHFGNEAGDRIQSSFPETYTATPYYKMWLWDPSSGSSVKFAYSDDGEIWHTDYPRDVCPRDEPGWLNPGSPIYDLEVLYDGGEYRGWADNNGRFYNVSSSDGTTWTLDPTTPIAINLGASGTWDDDSLSRMSVVKVSDTEWHAWYGGTEGGGGGNHGIGYATSADGITWTKDAANPVASLGGYGAFGGLGAPGSWNEVRNYAMSVLYRPDRFSGCGDAAELKMWRTGVNASGDYTIGYSAADVVTTYHLVFGDDRFLTAVQASKEAYPDGADTVVIATGLNWPDALGGTALAGAYGAPILLTTRDSLPDAVKTEIARLGATTATILGQTGAVSDAVKIELEDLGLAVQRIGGQDRYETANFVGAATIAARGGGYSGGAFVATGGNFPDALSASPLAAALGWPIYLAHPESGAPIAAMRAQGVDHVVILGGTSAVSGDTETALEDEFGDADVDRLYGDDRYETGVAVAEYASSSLGWCWDHLAVATGQNFPDALAGGLVPARQRSVLLLTRKSELPTVVSTALEAHRETIAHVYYLGGTSAVEQTARDGVAAVLR